MYMMSIWQVYHILSPRCRRTIPGREAADLRPVPDTVESPPAALLDPALGGSVPSSFSI